jgi:hypothetical protein
MRVLPSNFFLVMLNLFSSFRDRTLKLLNSRVVNLPANASYSKSMSSLDKTGVQSVHEYGSYLLFRVQKFKNTCVHMAVIR